MSKKRISDRAEGGSARGAAVVVGLPRAGGGAALRTLRALSRSVEEQSVPGAPAGEYADVARRILDFRKRRSDMLPAELFGEPAWDILLALHAGVENATVSGLAEHLGAPVTTMARWIRRMEEDGLVTRELRPFRPRLSAVRPTEKAGAIMNFYFSQMTKGGQ